MTIISSAKLPTTSQISSLRKTLPHCLPIVDFHRTSRLQIVVVSRLVLNLSYSARNHAEEDTLSRSNTGIESSGFIESTILSSRGRPARTVSSFDESHFGVSVSAFGSTDKGGAVIGRCKKVGAGTGDEVLSVVDAGRDTIYLKPETGTQGDSMSGVTTA